MEPKRVGLLVWIKHMRDAHRLERFGHVIYVSKRMKYAHLYVDEVNVQKVSSDLRKQPWVVRVEPSHRHEIPTEYDKKEPHQS